MKDGDYVRTKNGYICKVININDFREPSVRYCVDANYLKDFMFIGDEDIEKTSPNILELLEPLDLLYVDISPDNCGGIVVPRIPETQNELYKIICCIGRQEVVLKGVVTRERLINSMYKVGE